MIRRLFQRCLLRPSDLQPSREDFEVIGVFNPGVIALEGGVVLLVRVAERPRQQRAGFTGLPRWDLESGLTVDWVPKEEIEPINPQVVRLKHNGLIRLTSISHLRIAWSRDGHSIDSVTDMCFQPETPYEEYGVEDPRITRIGDVFYLTYVAVSRHGAATALASTTDFQTFQRHGVIFCPENKDVVLFPEKIGGEYLALHRPSGAVAFTMPEMWLARSPDLIHWGRHEHFLGGISSWEIGRIGAGPPPIRTPEGWLVIYHGSCEPAHGALGVYSAGALLLDIEDPRRILGQSKEPILVPQSDFEQHGFIPKVVFPTGLVGSRETLLVYYGAADTVTAVVELSQRDLFTALRSEIFPLTNFKKDLY